MIGYLLYDKEEGMPLIMGNISQMTTTSTPTGPYLLQEIFHNQIAKWLPYILDGFTNFIFGSLNQRWAVGVDLVSHVTTKVKNVLNHKISVANCNNPFGKKHDPETFP